MTRDELYVDPLLTASAQRQAASLGRRLRLDVVDTKEVYRAIIETAIEFTLAKQSSVVAAKV